MRKLTKALALLMMVCGLAMSCTEEVLQEISPADLEIITNTDGDDGDSKDNPPPPPAGG